MKLFVRIRQTLSPAACALFAVTLILSPAGLQAAGPQQGLDVTVVNTPDVNVANTPDVNVANLPAVQGVRNVDEKGRIPYAQDVVGNCNGVNCFIDFSVVPSGKRLVIEYVSAIVRPSSTATVVDFMELSTSSTADPGFAVRMYLPMQKIGSAGDSVVADTWAASGPVLAYVEEGINARLFISMSVGGNVVFTQGSITGYLVDIDGN
jgi:hypothetical protein